MRYLSSARAVIFCGLGLFILGCGGSGGNSYSLLAGEERFIQENASTFNNKLDILFVVNDQPSMSKFQAELVRSFSSFMSVFSTKGYDFKIAVVTTAGYMADPTLSGYSTSHVAEADFNDYNGTVYSGMPVIFPNDPNLFSNFAINAQPIKNTAGQDGRAFSSFRQALQSTRPRNTGFLRPDAFLAVVLVDNQDDFSGNARCVGCNMNQRYNAPTLDPIGTYIHFLDGLTESSGATRRYNVSAMTQSVTPCQAGTLMTRIMDLVTQTNGVIGDICQADFGPSMAQMSNKIAMLSTQFYLDSKPVVSSIVVRVDDVLINQDAANGWTYDSAANSIIFHGTSIPKQGASISVKYDPVSLNF